ncbi:MAG: transcriptional regulator [Bacteriovorax sp. MedPE-SWde]|nr:MAG: transcriptional regulator [Bacteriovorax sp. MedPE-SWde]
MIRSILLAITLVFNITLHAEMLTAVELKGDDGGRLDGKSWSSSEIKEKVYVLFYVDPDEKELNEHVGQALKKEKFPLTKYSSIAVINMAATWLPNFALESALEKKQKMYPDTLYVKDFKKVLVEKWSMKDDSSNVLLFNKKGELIYRIAGKAKDEQVKQLIKLVRTNLDS